MTTSVIVATTAQGWKRDPVGVASGTGRAPISAALWTKEEDGVLEVSGLPSPDNYTIAIAQTFVRSDMWLDGRLVYSKDIAPGSVQLIQPGTSPRAVIAGPIRSLQIYLPSRIVAEYAEACGMDGSHTPELLRQDNSYDPAIQRIGREVMGEILERQPLSQLRMDALGQELAIQLLRGHSSLAGKQALLAGTARGGLAPWQAKLVTSFMQERLADDISLADLADLVELSTAHFARAFRQSVGLPPHAWLVARRVERARELLASTDDGVLDIALACGFSHGQHLARAFRQQFGMTPGAWRRERQF